MWQDGPSIVEKLPKCYVWMEIWMGSERRTGFDRSHGDLDVEENGKGELLSCGVRDLPISRIPSDE